MNIFLSFLKIISPCTHLVLPLILPRQEREDSIVETTTAETVPTPLPPALSAEGDGAHLRAMLSLMRVPEGIAAYLTLGSLLSLADVDVNGDGKNGCRRGGG